jgi:hypothetical protein
MLEFRCRQTFPEYRGARTYFLVSTSQQLNPVDTINGSIHQTGTTKNSLFLTLGLGGRYIDISGGRLRGPIMKLPFHNPQPPSSQTKERRGEKESDVVDQRQTYSI